MDIKKAAALLLVLLALSSSLPVASQSGIVVSGADTVLDTSFTYSQDLVDTTSSAGPRVIVEYSDSTAPHHLIEIPAALQALADTVPARVIVEYADSTAPHHLIGIPAALQALADTVPARVIVEYADSTSPHALEIIPPALQALVSNVSARVVVEYSNSTRAAELAYPLELMNDSQPPKISGMAASGSGRITWTTDEFATSAVLYGTQTGVYTDTVSDPLYTKQHEITLPGLTMGTTYYYKVRSTDRSGNTVTSSEYSFTAQVFVYLPVVVRDY